MKRCQHPDCKNKILSMAICCGQCHKKFCAKHRLPEDHLCENLQELKDKKFQENSEKLMREKCVLKQVAV